LLDPIHLIASLYCKKGKIVEKKEKNNLAVQCEANGTLGRLLKGLGCFFFGFILLWVLFSI